MSPWCFLAIKFNSCLLNNSTLDGETFKPGDFLSMNRFDSQENYEVDRQASIISQYKRGWFRQPFNDNYRIYRNKEKKNTIEH